MGPSTTLLRVNVKEILQSLCNLFDQLKLNTNALYGASVWNLYNMDCAKSKHKIGGLNGHVGYVKKVWVQGGGAA